MSVKLYGIKNCDTIKKAKKWLEQQNIEYKFHDYRSDGIDRDLLNGFLQTQAWDLLLNKRGTTWRQQSDEIKNNIDQKSAIDLMLEHPAMIKRPVLVTPTTVLVGFKADQYRDIFSAEK
ncbi:MAG: ArsC family reductase [Pseudomonadales bacterium]|nr:ArsC family reductase [Pseudomonadales bacterium]NRA15374.1 ArsC family reductase [Oceanospirillaceae bacterium]